MGRGAVSQLNKLRHCDRCLEKRLGCDQEKPVCDRCTRAGASTAATCHYTIDSGKQELARKIYNQVKDPEVKKRCQRDFNELLGDPNALTCTATESASGNDPNIYRYSLS